MTDRTTTVVVTSDETLPDVIDRVRDAAKGGRTVHLVVPIDSALLLTANEFRQLKDAMDEQRLPLVVRTADPLRLRLGERLGIRTRAVPRPKPAVAVATLPSPEGQPTPVLPASQNGHDIGNEAAVPATPGLDPHALWPGPNGSDVASNAGGASDTEDARISRAAPANPPRRWLPVAALLVLIVLGAALAIRFVVPRAVVRIVPRVEPVTASLVFDIAAGERPLDEEAAFALAPSTREIEVDWEGSAPVTGVLAVPDGTASGPIELRNASGEPLTVDAGTEVSTEAGDAFVFAEAVTVPAMDAATGEPGAATGSVRAVDPGSGGNIDTGELGGRLPNGVYYSNRMEPTSGGTDKEFPVVAQADLDALSAQAEDAADELAADAVGQDDASSDVVMSSLTVMNQEDTFDHQVDDEAETVSLRSEMTVEVTVYDGAAAELEYEPALTKQLAAAAPDGFWVDPEQITFSEPVEVDGQEGGTRLEVTASVDAEARLSDTEQQALAQALAGATDGEAAATLAEAEEIADFSIEYQPSWLPERMPSNAGRITFELAE